MDYHRNKYLGIMIRILIFFSTLLLCHEELSSQRAAIYLDSLSRLKESPSDSIVILELKKVGSLARRESDESTLCESLMYLGYYYFDSDILAYESVVKESLLAVKRDSCVLPWIVASVYNNLAVLEATKKNFLFASEYLLKAIDLEKKGLNYTAHLAKMYSNISYYYSQLGDFSTSLDFVERSISYTAKSNDPRDKMKLALRLSKAGKVYFDSGNLDAALGKYTQAQIILDEIDISQSSNTFINNIQRRIELNLKNGDISNIQVHLKTLEKAGKKSSYRSFRTMYLNGEYQKRQGNDKKAHEYYDKAIKLLKEDVERDRDHSLLEHVYKLKADAYYQARNYSKALETVHEGLTSLDQEIQDNYFQNPNGTKYDSYPIAKDLLLLKARSSIAVAEKEGAKYQEIANQAYMDLCLLLDVMKRAYLSEGSKYFVSENAQPIYEEIIEVFANQYEDNKSQDILDKLIYVMQANKSTILFNAIKRKVDILASDIPVDQINKEIELKNQKSYYDEILCKEELEIPVDSNLIKALKSEIFELNESLEIHDKKMAQLYPEYYNYKERQSLVPSKEKIWSQMNSKEAILLFFKGKEKYYLVKLHKGKVSFETVAEETVASVEQFQELISRKPDSELEFKNTLEKSQLLGSSLLKEMSDKNIEYLYIIPDGVFSKVPFDALSVNGDYAVQKLNISYFLSLQQFVDSKAQKSVGKTSMYGLAPDFSNLDRTENRILPKGLQNLPFAKQEVEFLGDLFATPVKSDSLTYTTDLINHAKDYSIIHLATHAIVNEIDPMLSEIYFNDGALTVFDIQGLNIKPEFVMLSACNTAVGTNQKGEGVISLSRGFFQAGVESIQSSLWPLDDYSSSDIVKDMYGHLKKGDEKSIALRKSKVKYLANADVLRSHPYYWAGIVQIGNNGALFQSSNNSLLWLLALFLAMVLIIIYLRLKS